MFRRSSYVACPLALASSWVFGCTGYVQDPTPNDRRSPVRPAVHFDGGAGVSATDAAAPSPSFPPAPIRRPAPYPLPPPGPPAKFVSNIPGAAVTETGATPGLALLSLNVTEEPGGASVFQRWLGEVQNVGSATACLVSLEISLRTASDAEVLSLDRAYVDGTPFVRAGSSLVVSCLRPGEIGGFASLRFVDSATPRTNVTSIAVQFERLRASRTTRDPNAPRVEAQAVSVPGGYGVHGTLVGQNGVIHSIFVTAYPRDARGLVLGWLFDGSTDTLRPGDTHTFMAGQVEEPFTDFRVFTRYDEGDGTDDDFRGLAAGVVALVQPADESPSTDPADAIDAAIEGARQARASNEANLQAARADR